jgi:hypothetical protein
MKLKERDLIEDMLKEADVPMLVRFGEQVRQMTLPQRIAMLIAHRDTLIRQITNMRPDESERTL